MAKKNMLAMTKYVQHSLELTEYKLIHIHLIGGTII
jgi:hypothetical protein